MAHRATKLADRATASAEKLFGVSDDVLDVVSGGATMLKNWTRVGVIGSEQAVLRKESSVEFTQLQDELRNFQQLKEIQAQRKAAGMDD